MIAAVAFLVRDYDEAISWFARCLGFMLFEDMPLGGSRRWVVMGPAGGGTRLLLAKADWEMQEAAVGKAAGGRIAFFLHTDDFARNHAAMLARGVRFRQAPRREPYGTVAVFEDIYGNGWDLIQPA